MKGGSYVGTDAHRQAVAMERLADTLEKYGHTQERIAAALEKIATWSHGVPYKPGKRAVPRLRNVCSGGLHLR